MITAIYPTPRCLLTVAVVIRSYGTMVEYLYDTPNASPMVRLVQGDLRLRSVCDPGNAGGGITRCEHPESVDVARNMRARPTGCIARLVPGGGKEALATLPSTSSGLPCPGTRRVGNPWLHGVERHLADPMAVPGHEAIEAWAG